MTNNERIGAAKALCDWFASQEITPKDGVLIMAMLLGTQIGTMAKDEADAAEGLAALTVAASGAAHSVLVRR